MASIGSSLAVIEAKNILITNLSVPTASNEVSHVLQSGLKYLEISNRGSARTQFAFVSNESGTKYRTIWPNSTWYMNGISFSGKTLYVQCDADTQVLEIIELY